MLDFDVKKAAFLGLWKIEANRICYLPVFFF
jgi:hypothetical protein